VQSLTLLADKPTAHRRVAAVPQLKCVSPKAVCALHKVDVMRCTNQGAGYDGEDIQWSCTASLPPELKLGSTDVACEGYASRDDPYVLRGSCGVEYRLVLTDAGERRYKDLGGTAAHGETDRSAWVFGVIFVAVAVWILWSACVANDGGAGDQRQPRRPQRRNNFWGGGGGWGPGPGGGGGGGGFNDPPPPYPGTKPSDGNGAGGWQPGFWSGLAGGAAAGYWAGRSGNGRENRRGYDPRYAGYGENWNAGPSNSGSGSGSGSSSTSGARYESTGFGGTSRR